MKILIKENIMKIKSFLINIICIQMEISHMKQKK